MQTILVTGDYHFRISCIQDPDVKDRMKAMVYFGFLVESVEWTGEEQAGTWWKWESWDGIVFLCLARPLD